MSEKTLRCLFWLICAVQVVALSGLAHAAWKANRAIKASLWLQCQNWAEDGNAPSNCTKYLKIPDPFGKLPNLHLHRGGRR